LAIYAGATVNGQDFQVVDVGGIVVEVVSYLEAELTSRTKDEGLWGCVGDVNVLDEGKAECGGFSCAGLRKGNDLVCFAQ